MAARAHETPDAGAKTTRRTLPKPPREKAGSKASSVWATVLSEPIAGINAFSSNLAFGHAHDADISMVRPHHPCGMRSITREAAPASASLFSSQPALVPQHCLCESDPALRSPWRRCHHSLPLLVWTSMAKERTGCGCTTRLALPGQRRCPPCPPQSSRCTCTMAVRRHQPWPWPADRHCSYTKA